MGSMIPLMLVPLIVWIAVWGYLWALDRRVKDLSAMVERGRPESEVDGE